MHDMLTNNLHTVSIQHSVYTKYNLDITNCNCRYTKVELIILIPKIHCSCPSFMTDKQNVVHIHTVEHYSVIKRNEVLIHAATWMNPENIILNNRSQTQKATYFIISFLWNTWNRQSHEDRKYIICSRGWGKGRIRVSFWGDGNALELLVIVTT